MRCLIMIGSVALSVAALAATGTWTAYDEAEYQLNQAYRSLMLRLSPPERLKLRDLERAWIATRNRTCGREAKNACATRMSIARGRELDREWVSRFMPRIGECFSTTVKQVGTRLEGDSEESNGASVAYADGHYQVDYESSPKTLGFRAGDPARLCVVSLPRGCPIGDHRGIVYKAVDRATRRTWTAADSEHSCGGA